MKDKMTLEALTAAINKLPRLPTRIRSMGLFAPKPITTTTILIDEVEGRLSLVPNSARGGAGHNVKSGTRKTRSFQATHLPQYRKVLAEDSQGIRKFGTEDQAEAVADVVNSRMQEMQNNILLTREWQHMGAIKGKILDANGTTVLADMYDEFGVTQKSVQMSLASNTNPRAKLMEAKRASEKSLGGVLANGSKVLCSPDFMDALTGNEAVKAAYAGWQSAQDRLGGDVRGGFIYGGCEFIEYDASVGETPFIAAGEAYLFPSAPGLFIETFSPADYVETVNTLGLEFYAKAKELDFNKGWELEAQSNPLSLCTMPGACIKLLAA